MAHRLRGQLQGSLQLRLSSHLPSPGPQGEQGVSLPFTAAPSCGIWAAQASPLTCFRGGRSGRGCRGIRATQLPSTPPGRPSWAIFTSRCPSAAKDVSSSLLSLGPNLRADHAHESGPGICLPTPLYLYVCQRHETLCVCAGMCARVCMACVCRTLYACAACRREGVCTCMWLQDSVQHAWDACMYMCACI